MHAHLGHWLRSGESRNRGKVNEAVVSSLLFPCVWWKEAGREGQEQLYCIIPGTDAHLISSQGPQLMELIGILCCFCSSCSLSGALCCLHWFEIECFKPVGLGISPKHNSVISLSLFPSAASVFGCHIIIFLRGSASVSSFLNEIFWW